MSQTRYRVVAGQLNNPAVMLSAGWLLRLAVIAGCVLLPMGSAATAAQSRAPNSEDTSITMTLVASAPDIVTPIGVVVDAKGRVLLLESHTQKPEKGYAGPKCDRVKAFAVVTGDGSRWTNRVVPTVEDVPHAGWPVGGTHGRGLPQLAGLSGGVAVREGRQAEK